MVLYYPFACLVALIKAIDQGRDHGGWRQAAYNVMRRIPLPKFLLKIVQWLFIIYMVGGLAVGGVTAGLSANYILNLRAWVNRSGWIDTSQGGNPEDDPTTFGQ